jgi:hypothetical protein
MDFAIKRDGEGSEGVAHWASQSRFMITRPSYWRRDRLQVEVDEGTLQLIAINADIIPRISE